MREVSWMPLSVALAKMSADLPFIDEWQQEQLRKCGLYRRERPLVTEEILRQLQALGSVSAAKKASLERRVEIAARNLAAQAERCSGSVKEASYPYHNTPSQVRGVGVGVGGASPKRPIPKP